MILLWISLWMNANVSWTTRTSCMNSSGWSVGRMDKTAVFLVKWRRSFMQRDWDINAKMCMSERIFFMFDSYRLGFRRRSDASVLIAICWMMPSTSSRSCCRSERRGMAVKMRRSWNLDTPFPRPAANALLLTAFDFAFPTDKSPHLFNFDTPYWLLLQNYVLTQTLYWILRCRGSFSEI